MTFARFCRVDLYRVAGDELEYWAWLLSLTAVGVVIAFDEYLKYSFRMEDARLAEHGQMHDFFNGVLSEMRQLRHHLNDIETKLQLRENRPARRPAIQESAKALARALAAQGIATHAVGEPSEAQRQAVQSWATHTYRSYSVLPGDEPAN